MIPEKASFARCSDFTCRLPPLRKLFQLSAAAEVLGGHTFFAFELDIRQAHKPVGDFDDKAFAVNDRSRLGIGRTLFKARAVYFEIFSVKRAESARCGA